MGVALLSVFGSLALALASIGLYGIMAYSVNQRKREIGLRMAFGAAQGSVLRLILKQGMSLVVKGMLIGFAASLLVGRILGRMLYGVSATDPLSVGSAAVVYWPSPCWLVICRRAGLAASIHWWPYARDDAKPRPAIVRILWTITVLLIADRRGDRIP